ncbi:unnamed protein product [Darwinula stevensoni]|uniref:Uncharacterized protein n=1 Tax=Darwinula stevensoni TaxID=69355 RepID=A0A7R9A143_9CRUS|nr:unnamed protein product [Darwinula stevensoni]CAG0886953.1 unnamed protein product [Darwinula stevensoni]
MDILGSIMSSMDKPPPVNTAAKKKEEETLKKAQAEVKKKWNKFRTMIEQKIEDFVKDPNQGELKFDTMDRMERSLISQYPSHISCPTHKCWISQMADNEAPKRRKRGIRENSHKDIAIVAVAKQQYGCVPSDKKRDLRTIEETLADLRERKRHKKTSNDTSS